MSASGSQKKATDSKNELKQIPRDLHFVWLGGIPPERSQANIIQWRRMNPGYTVNLWYDPDYITPDKLITLRNWAAQNNITLRNTDDELGRIDYAKYVAAGPRPNYGAASDIYRYNILKRFGGCYLDTDIYTESAMPLPASGFSNETGLMFTRRSMGSQMINCDLIAAIPDEPHIASMIEQLNRNLQGRELYHSHDLAYLSNVDMNHITIGVTGPHFLRRYIAKDFKKNDFRDDPPRIAFYDNCEMPYGDFNWIQLVDKYHFPEELQKCFRSTRGEASWLAKRDDDDQCLPQKNYSSEYKSAPDERAAKDIFTRVKFETERFGVLDIPYYLACLPIDMDKQQVCEQVCQQLYKDAAVLEKAAQSPRTLTSFTCDRVEGIALMKHKSHSPEFYYFKFDPVVKENITKQLQQLFNRIENIKQQKVTASASLAPSAAFFPPPHEGTATTSKKSDSPPAPVDVNAHKSKANKNS